MLNETTAQAARTAIFVTRTEESRTELVELLVKAITPSQVKALRTISEGGVTFFYRSPKKIKGTRLVHAQSHAQANTPVLDGGVSAKMWMLLNEHSLVSSKSNGYGTYTATLTALGREVLAAK